MGDIIFSVASDVERIMKGFKAAATNQEELKAIRVTRPAELVDRYHNSIGFKPVPTMRLDAKEMLKYNSDKKVIFSLLNESRIEFAHPAIGDVKEKYCTSGAGEFSRDFSRGQ